MDYIEEIWQYIQDLGVFDIDYMHYVDTAKETILGLPAEVLIGIGALAGVIVSALMFKAVHGHDKERW